MTNFHCNRPHGNSSYGYLTSGKCSIEPLKNYFNYEHPFAFDFLKKTRPRPGIFKRFFKNKKKYPSFALAKLVTSWDQAKTCDLFFN